MSKNSIFVIDEKKRNHTCCFCSHHYPNIHIYYEFQYGAYSTISFNDFDNQTIYKVSNMPKNGKNELLSLRQVEEIAENYQLEYIENSLVLESNISFNWDRPEYLKEVDFAYKYRYKIGNATFEAIARNNSSAHSTHQIF